MRLLIVPASLFLFFSFSVFSQKGSCEENVDHPDYRSIEEISSGGAIIREYLLYIPENYDAEKETPLIINMHGFGGCAKDFYESVGNQYSLHDLANQENFMVAYPQAAYRPAKEDHYWEPGDNGAEDIFENDVYFLDQLIADVGMDYNLDETKVFASGYSNGGMMAYSLACNRSDVYSGIAIMSGTMLEEECNPAEAMPIIVFHGIDDYVLPYNGNQWYQSIPDIIEFWLDLNGIPSSSLSSTELKDGEVIRDEYSNENENSCMTFYTVQEEYGKPGGHVWFSEDIEDASPNEIMWDFFKNQCNQFIAIDDFTKDNDIIQLSPNPFSNQIHLTTSQGEGQHFSIKNIQGKEMLYGKLTTDQLIIDTNSWPSNLYIIQVGKTIQKVLKL